MSLLGKLRYVRDTILKSPLPMLTPGTAAPEMGVEDDMGTLTRLADLRGKYVVLWFFPKAGTPG